MRNLRRGVRSGRMLTCDVDRKSWVSRERKSWRAALILSAFCEQSKTSSYLGVNCKMVSQLEKCHHFGLFVTRHGSSVLANTFPTVAYLWRHARPQQLIAVGQRCATSCEQVATAQHEFHLVVNPTGLRRCLTQQHPAEMPKYCSVPNCLNDSESGDKKKSFFK